MKIILKDFGFFLGTNEESFKIQKNWEFSGVFHGLSLT